MHINSFGKQLKNTNKIIYINKLTVKKAYKFNIKSYNSLYSK